MRNFLAAFPVLAVLAISAQARPLAFVINSGEASRQPDRHGHPPEIKRIPCCGSRDHMALTPDGASLLIGDTAGNALLFLDPQTGECSAG